MLELDPAQARCLPLEGREDHARAIDLLLGWAERKVSLFDFDLCDNGWNSTLRAEVLRSFFRRSRLAHCEIYLRDASRVALRLPRIMALLRSYGHALTIYQVGEEGQQVYDPFLIVDDRHYWHRFHFDQPRGELGVEQPRYAFELARRLAEIKEISSPANQATVLGL